MLNFIILIWEQVFQLKIQKEKFLENAFKSYCDGKISSEAYDYLLENIYDYVDEDEDDEDEKVNA